MAFGFCAKVENGVNRSTSGGATVIGFIFTWGFLLHDCLCSLREAVMPLAKARRLRLNCTHQRLVHRSTDRDAHCSDVIVVASVRPLRRLLNNPLKTADQQHCGHDWLLDHWTQSQPSRIPVRGSFESNWRQPFLPRVPTVTITD